VNDVVDIGVNDEIGSLRWDRIRTRAGAPDEGSFRSAPQQKDHNDDYQYRAKSPAIIMVRSAQIETTAAEKENQNKQE
jgi:hypothetical protein